MLVFRRLGISDFQFRGVLLMSQFKSRKKTKKFWEFKEHSQVPLWQAQDSVPVFSVFPASAMYLFCTAVTAVCAKASLLKSNTPLNTSDGSSMPTWGKQCKLFSWTTKTLDNLALRRLHMPTFRHSPSAPRSPKRMLLWLCMHCACCYPSLALLFCLKKSWLSFKAPSNATFLMKFVHSLLAKYPFLYFL